eukprot:TRINITY_DN3989_c0_g1_i6.p1 TRINITY_DN3989_c0_g1~~TRINITY_DN3989_c0_g1_i6.p1  ORF type:complete len:473 (-),score=148.89 TRINITY_DN3989_c0_g1_i6:260-1678(-)
MAETKPPSKGVIVIKIGTSSLMREGSPAGDSTVSSAAGALLGATGGSELALSTLALLVDTVLVLRRDGWDVILVSSGAVGVGCSRLGTAVRPVRGGATAAERAANLAAIQAYAAIGQSVLMRTYDDLFRVGGQPVAQVLLTSGDLSSQYQYNNAKATLRSLLSMGVVPIVNENDTVATEELRYGDNDWLSALVACVVDATWLFLLTDVERLYTADPRRDAGAEAIDLVSDMAALSVDTSARAPPPAEANGDASGDDAGSTDADADAIDVGSRTLSSPSSTSSLASVTTSAETIALVTATATAAERRKRQEKKASPPPTALLATLPPQRPPTLPLRRRAPSGARAAWPPNSPPPAWRPPRACGWRCSTAACRRASSTLWRATPRRSAPSSPRARRQSKTTRKRWIAHCLPPTGSVVLDRGAVAAVRGRKTCLRPALSGWRGTLSPMTRLLCGARAGAKSRGGSSTWAPQTCGG